MYFVYDESIKLGGVLWFNVYNYVVYYVNLVNKVYFMSVFGFYNCI